MENRTIKCPGCGQTVEADGEHVVHYHDDAPPLRSVCVYSGMNVAHVLAWLDESIAAERAAHAEEVRALKEKLAAVYGGLNHAAESGVRNIADATATERAACFEIAFKISRHACCCDDYTRGRADAAAEIAQAIDARSKGGES